ncbi:MAG: energy transducer TonB [Candidatus Sedimenticola sp. 20ELBAFRAG]
MRTAAKISPVDRLGLTLFFAVSLHVVLILGVTFTIEKAKKQPPPERTIEIMVVQNPKKSDKPEKADYLAQVSQQGGGQQEEKVRPTTQITPPARAVPSPAQENRPAAPPAPPKKTEPKRVITKKAPAKKKIDTTPKAKKQKPKKKRLTAAQLLASTDQEIQRLTAELDRKTKAYAKRPRRKRLTASTQEYTYASYLDTWRRKVENVGNLNYPDEAKRRKLYGNLILHVAVKKDGTVERIRVLKSSGHKLLDDAAMRIVRLASPFSPFPAEIRKETDILDITRTWQFLHSNKLYAK